MLYTRILFVVFALCLGTEVVKSQDYHRCLNNLYKDALAKECPNLESIIECLQKTKAAIPQTLKSAHEIEKNDYLIQFYQRLKSQENCPILTQAGSCVRKEIQLCTNESPRKFDSYTELCRRTTSAFNCLSNLGGKCREIDRIVKEIDARRKTVNSCKIGRYNALARGEECNGKIEKCSDEFRGLGEDLGADVDTCQKIGIATTCLGDLFKMCKEFTKDPNVMSMIKYSDYIERHFDCGREREICSDSALTRCTATVLRQQQQQTEKKPSRYARSEEDESETDEDESETDENESEEDESSGHWYHHHKKHDHHDESRCSFTNQNEAARCILDLRPHCSSKEQIGRFLYHVSTFLDSCRHYRHNHRHHHRHHHRSA